MNMKSFKKKNHLLNRNIGKKIVFAIRLFSKIVQPNQAPFRHRYYFNSIDLAPVSKIPQTIPNPIYKYVHKFMWEKNNYLFVCLFLLLY